MNSQTNISNTPLVSMVIPCFNSAEFIGQSIDSCLAQDYPNCEVVIIDDGSTDNSVEVLKSYGDAIRWETGPNLGACAARNRGWRLASGDFIQFNDADDELSSDKLSKQMPHVVKHPGALVFCAGEFMDPNRQHPHHNRTDDCSDSLTYMLRGGLPTPAPIHRREWLEQAGGWNESLPCAQERDLHLRIAALGIPFIRIPDVLYRVRPVEKSVSSSHVRVLDQHASTVRAVIDILEAERRLTDEYRHELAGFLARDARMYFRLGESQKGKDYVQLANELHASGGTDLAYSGVTNVIRRLVGAAFTEKLVMMKGRR